jgi:hypothetical protein
MAIYVLIKEEYIPTLEFHASGPHPPTPSPKIGRREESLSKSLS